LTNHLNTIDYHEIEETGDDKMSGVHCLGSVEHKLVLHKDGKTASFSGLVGTKYA
jgi:hypothetical protein